MKKSNNPLSDYSRYSSIAIQMLVIIGGGVIGGFYLDRWINWKFPVFTVAFSFLSVALAIFITLREFFRPKK
jgi:ATP synthase protein I